MFCTQWFQQIPFVFNWCTLADGLINWMCRRAIICKAANVFSGNPFPMNVLCVKGPCMSADRKRRKASFQWSECDEATLPVVQRVKLSSAAVCFNVQGFDDSAAAVYSVHCKLQPYCSLGAVGLLPGWEFSCTCEGGSFLLSEARHHTPCKRPTEGKGRSALDTGGPIEVTNCNDRATWEECVCVWCCVY